MKKYKIALFFIILLLAAAIGFYFVTNNDAVDVSPDSSNSTKQIKQENFTNTNPVTVLTPEVITRLQNYPYQKEPELGFKQIIEQRPDLAKKIVDEFYGNFSNIIKAYGNAKFFTNESLSYQTWDYHYVVRGILQITYDNGKVIEQDIEFEYSFGGWDNKGKFFFKEKRVLSDPKTIRG